MLATLYLESVNNCFNIQSEKTMARINVPTEDKSAMKDIAFSSQID